MNADTKDRKAKKKNKKKADDVESKTEKKKVKKTKRIAEDGENHHAKQNGHDTSTHKDDKKKKKKKQTRKDDDDKEKKVKKKLKKSKEHKNSTDKKAKKKKKLIKEGKKHREKTRQTAAPTLGDLGACTQDCGCDVFYGKAEMCQNCGHGKSDHVLQDQPENKKGKDKTALPSSSSTICPGDTPEDITRKFKTTVGGLITSFSWEIDPAELVFKQRLGEGASAKVWKGEYRGQEVAIKVLKDRVEPAQLRDFKKEFELMGSLRSTHIVFFFGACVQPSLCMVMEWCSHGSLNDVLKTDKMIDWPMAFKFFVQTMRAINCLHEWKPAIVHRDLKSPNLLVDQSWTVKVADFGLSRSTEDNNLQTLNKLRGTYAYTAPEVYFGNKYTTKADVFSLSIIMWEIVARIMTGVYKAPYAEYKHLVFDFQIIIQTAKNNLRPTIPQGAPERLTSMMTSAWSKEPDERPSCAQLMVQLKAAEEEYERNKREWDALLPTPSAASS